MVLSTGKKVMMASLFIVAVACVLIGIASVSDESSAHQGDQYTVDGITYLELASGDVWVYSTTDDFKANTTTFTIPATITYEEIEHNVARIKGSAFAGCTNLTTVTIPSTINYIENYAFEGCKNLKTVYYNATRNTNSLSAYANIIDNPEKESSNNPTGMSVYIGANVTSLPSSTFSRLNGTTFYLAEGSQLSVIGAYAFGSNSDVYKTIIAFDLPSTLTELGGYAFQRAQFTGGTIATDGLTIGPTLTTISSAVFEKAYVPKVTINSTRVTYDIGLNANEVIIGDTVTAVNGYQIGSKTIKLHIGSGVATINSTIFQTANISELSLSENNDNFLLDGGVLYSLSEGATVSLLYMSPGSSVSEIPSTVTSIGDYAAYKKTIDSITIPATVATIGTDAFKNSRITNAYVAKSSIEAGVFMGSTIGTLTLRETAGSIGANAFENAILASVTGLDNITSFGDYCFKGSNIDSVSFGTVSDITIGDYAFSETYLTSLLITDKVVSIGSHAFYSNPLLKTVKLMAVPGSIGELAFETLYSTNAELYSMQVIDANDEETNALNDYVQDTALNTLQYEPGDRTPLDSDAIKYSYVASTKTLTLSAGTSTTLPSSAVPWESLKKFVKIIIIDDDIVTVNSASVSDFLVCEELTIGAGVRYFNGGANNLHNLKALTFSATNLTSFPSDGLKGAGTASGGVTVSFSGNVASVPQAFIGSTSTANITGLIFDISCNTTFYTQSFYNTNNVGYVEIRQIGTVTLNSAFVDHIGDDASQFHLKFANNITEVPFFVTEFIRNASKITFGSGFTSIGNSQVSNNVKLTEVVLPDNCTTIGDGAFGGCVNLATIDLSNVESIGQNAFSGCRSLVNDFTDLGSAVTIGDGAFSGADSASAPKLGRIDIHSVTTLDSRAFKYAGVTGDVIIDGVCAFGRDYGNEGEIFYGCDIASLTVSSGNLINPNILDGIVNPINLILGGHSNNAFQGSDRIATLTIPSATSISEGAFKDCTNLSTIVIQGDRTGNSRLLINVNAFKGCTSLTGIDLSKVRQINPSAFSGCTSLFAEEDSLVFDDVVLMDDSFYGCSALHGTVTLTDCQLIYEYHTVVPFSGTAITALVFSGDSDVETADIVNGITSESYALTVNGSNLPNCRGDTKLAAVTIGPTVTGSGDFLAFMDCTNLSTVVFNAESFTSNFYGEENGGPFDGLLQTITVTIGEGVSTIPAYMFYGLTLDGDHDFGTVTIGDSAFSNSHCGALSFGAGSVIGDNAFYNATATSITLDDNVTLGEYAFSGCTATSVSLGTVASWDVYAFSSMGNLESITFSGTETIGNYAFSGSGNQSLNTVSLPDSLTTIGEYAFRGCNYLVSMTIPASVTEIGTSAFDGCQRLMNITINNIADATEQQKLAIGGAAFRNTGLTMVVIPSRVASLGSQSFGGILVLGLVSIEANLTAGASAFLGSGYDDHDLTVTFAPGVTSIPAGLLRGSQVTSIGSFNDVAAIGDNAFEECTRLTSINLPAATIGENAFTGCTGLTTITIPSGVTSIGMRAFSGCTGLTSVTVLADADWGTYVFENCTRLTSLTLPIEYNMANTSLGGLSGITTIAFVKANDGVGFDYSSNPVNRVWYNNSVSAITIGDGVLSIGNYMFYGCTSNAVLSLPNSINTYRESVFADSSISIGTVNIVSDGVVDSNAFYHATGITAFNVDAQHMSYASDNSGVMFNKNLSTVIYYPAGRDASSYTVPDTVTIISTGSFAGATNLTSIVLPSGLQSIYSSAFYGCTGLTAIDLPDGLKNVDRLAFCGCTGLRSIYIPSTLTNLGYDAFKGINFKDSEGALMNDENGFTNGAQSDAIGFTFVYIDQNNGPVLGQRCTVKFITGDYVEDVDPVPPVAVGGKVSAPAQPPEAVDGYDFGGWFANEGCTIPWDFDTDTVSSNTMIYAKAAPEEYTITLHDRTGPDSQSTDSYTVRYHDTAINVQIPNVENKFMYGIYYRVADPENQEQFIYTSLTESDLTFSYSQAASSFLDENGRWIYRGNVELYVMWDDMLVTVTYHINNGGDNLDYSTVRWYDEYAYLASSTFTANTGYEFVCWNTLANGQGYSHAAGEEFEFPDDAEYGEVITLYAQWRLIDYSITYEMNGGGTNDNRN
ncbi:MAG: leucine-rich repeat protein, partial [Candidatus Methanomethylophilaceae archaeon]|nr:leucine-rich repeat protein [Candidatus Methanomethylophilaceae archaeon]